MTQKTLKKFILSHLVIELVALTAVVPVFMFANGMARDKQIDSTYVLLQGAVSRISTQFQGAFDAVNIMHNNQLLRGTMQLGDDLTGIQYYEAGQSQKMWYLTTLSWDLLRDSYVVFAKNDIVFSPNRVFFSYEDFYGYWLSVDGMDIDQWRARVSGDIIKARKTAYPVERIYTFEREKQVDGIVYCIPFVDTFNSGMVISVVDVEDMLKALDVGEGRSAGLVSIYGPGGSLLYNCGGEEPLSARETAIAEMRIGGQNHLVFTLADQAAGFTYVVGMSEAVISGAYTRTFNGLLMYVVAASLIASALSGYFAYRQYSPLKKLRSALKSVIDVQEGQKDEYEYFHDSFMEVYGANQRFRRTIEDFTRALESRALDDLLRGRYASPEELDDLAKRCKLPERYRLCIAHLNLEGAQDWTRQAEARVISAELMDTISKSWLGEVLMHPLSERRLLFVIPEDELAGDAKVKISGAAQSLKRDVGLSPVFALSAVYEGADKLAEAYAEVKSVLAYRYISDALVLLPEAAPEDAPPPVLSQEGSTRLREHLLAGDSARASDFIRACLRGRYMRERDYGQMYFSIRGVMMLAISSAMAGADMPELPFYTEERQRDEQTQELLVACERLCAAVSGRKRSHNEQMKTNMLAYLRDNYASPDVYGKSVAATFGISEKYLYTFFREQTGLSFATYLESLRLDRAAELLKNSKFTVNEIAAMTGFNSPNTFYKAFKRLYDMSPSEYRSAQGRKID